MSPSACSRAPPLCHACARTRTQVTWIVQTGFCTHVRMHIHRLSTPACLQVLANEFGDLVNRLIITRHGSPTRPLDLARVSASRAGTVIWVPPQEADGESTVSAHMPCVHLRTHVSAHALRPPAHTCKCTCPASTCAHSKSTCAHSKSTYALRPPAHTCPSMAEAGSSIAQCFAQEGVIKYVQVVS